MRFSAIAAVTAMAPALISAHGGSGGFNAASLKARSVFDTIRAEAQAAEDHVHARDASEKRQVGGTDGQCGPNIGSCAAGYCCSQVHRPTRWSSPADGSGRLVRQHGRILLLAGLQVCLRPRLPGQRDAGGHQHVVDCPHQGRVGALRRRGRLRLHGTAALGLVPASLTW